MLSPFTLAFSTRRPPPLDDPAEVFDLPPAVLCALCGLGDCVDCQPVETKTNAFVPWEQRGGHVWKRLWTTAHESSVNGERFFAALPDGGVSRALVFAFACELLAIGSIALLWIAFAFALAPEVVGAPLSGERRWTIVGAVLLAVPVLAVMMVLLHVVWGAAMELGVKLQGEPTRLSHVLRYALYSCGWDLLTSPIGVAAGSVTHGPLGALRSLRAAMMVPRRATRAYLREARSLDDDSARRAVWAAALATGALVITGAIAFIGLAVTLWLYL